MRTFLDGTGADSTSAVLAYLSTHRELKIADLYVISTAPSYQGNYMGKSFFVTDHPSSLLWGPRGTFFPGVISRGEVESAIGLDVQKLNIQWSPQDADILASVSGGGDTLLTALQGFGFGLFDDGLVEVWRCLMPTEGDAQTLGACNMFTGRIGDIVPDRSQVQMTIVSRLETLNEQVPTNLIEPTNILSFYTTGQVLFSGPHTFEVLTGSTPQILIADPTDGTDTTSDSWDDGYIVMIDPSQLGGTYRGVRQQVYNGSHHIFYLYDPMPFAPLVGDLFNAFILVPTDQASAATQMSEFDGFPYVPSPINSAVIIG